MPMHWVAGSSAGAVMAALIAGSPDACGLRGFASSAPATERPAPLLGGIFMAESVPSARDWLAVAAIFIRGCYRSIHLRSAASMTCVRAGSAESACRFWPAKQQRNPGNGGRDGYGNWRAGGVRYVVDTLEIDHLLGKCGFLTDSGRVERPASRGRRIIVERAFIPRQDY
jgi:hypothetical protein